MRSIVQVYGPNLRIFRSFDLFGVKDLCNNLRTLSIISQTVFVNYYSTSIVSNFSVLYNILVE